MHRRYPLTHLGSKDG